MDCPSCMELFDEKQHLPLNFECGHSYCNKCVTRMINEFNLKNCPECRVPISTNLKDLTPNLTILQILSEKRELEKYKKACNKHPEFYMDFQCKNCDISICKMCLIEHSGHLVMPLNHSNSKIKKKMQELSKSIKQVLLELDLRILYNSEMLHRVINHQYFCQK
jgi:hypothetical protein